MSEAPPSKTRRTDAPPVHAYRRGDKATALALASDPSRAQAAARSLQEAAYTAGSRAAQNARIKLWCELCEAMGVQDPFRLSPSLIHHVVGVLRDAGYRTAMAHLYQVLAVCRTRDITVSPSVLQAVADAKRACARGAGPPRHATPLPVARLMRLQEAEQPATADGPMHPRRALLLGCWWVTREIELSNTLIEDIDVTVEGEATWNLSASKTDPRALGASRTHKCACSMSLSAAMRLDRHNCPSCLLRDQVSYATRQAGGTSAAPLFPTLTGACPSKRGMVLTIAAIAAELGLASTTLSGAPAWGGHAMRVGGIQYLATCGIDVWRIQALARHSSNAVLIYLNGVHARNLGNVASDTAVLGTTLQDMRSQIKMLQEHASRSATKEDLSSALRAPSNSLSIACTPFEVCPDLSAAPPPPPAAGEYISSCGPGGRVHIRRRDTPTTTWCGWQWTLHKRASVHDAAPDGLMCIRCTKAALRMKSAESSSSEGSDTP